MAKLEVLYKGKKITLANQKTLGVVVDFATFGKTLTVDTIEIEGVDACDIYNQVDGGCQPTPSVWEAGKLDFYIDGNLFLEGGLDLRRGTLSRSKVTGQFRQKAGIDAFNDLANAYRFEILVDKGIITKDDFIPVWYQIGAYPRKAEIAITAFTIYSVIREIIRTIKDIADVISLAGNVITIIAAIGQSLALLIYLIGLIVAMVNLLKLIIDLIFPFVYYHHGMFVADAMRIGCAQIGLGFSSTIISSRPGLAVMPTKNTEGVKVGKQLDEIGTPEGSLADFTLQLASLFEAEAKVLNGTLYLENYLFFANQATFVIPSIPLDEESFSLNADVVESNFFKSYSFDPIDVFSYEAKEGYSVHASREATNVVDPANVVLAGLGEGTENFCLPNIKESETGLEKAMRKVYNGVTNLVNAIKSAINTVKRVFNKNAQPAPKIPTIPKSGGKNTIQMDTHFTSVPKIFITDGKGKVDKAATQAHLSMRALYSDLFSAFSPVPGSSATPYQWRRLSRTFTLCYQDFVTLAQNNYAIYKGVPARILRLTWIFESNQATIDFEVNRIYDCNLTESIVYDGKK